MSFLRQKINPTLVGILFLAFYLVSTLEARSLELQFQVPERFCTIIFKQPPQLEQKSALEKIFNNMNCSFQSEKVEDFFPRSREFSDYSFVFWFDDKFLRLFHSPSGLQWAQEKFDLRAIAPHRIEVSLPDVLQSLLKRLPVTGLIHSNNKFFVWTAVKNQKLEVVQLKWEKHSFAQKVLQFDLQSFGKTSNYSSSRRDELSANLKPQAPPSLWLAWTER